MKMEELLSAASDEMEHDPPLSLSEITPLPLPLPLPSSSSRSPPPSRPHPRPPSSLPKGKVSPPSRNTMRTRSKKNSSSSSSSHSPSFVLDAESPPFSLNPPPSSAPLSALTIPTTSTSTTASTTNTNNPSNNSNNSNTSNNNSTSPNVNNQVAAQCKTPGCVVCLKGPPPSFSKGTPIWAQILHLVLYALTESSKYNVLGSPKPTKKRYFHLRDDIYEYIAIHWDVICRRERIKNWRHTIGMTLSHYQNLFQNGYHIYQNTGYWSMKDNVPSPYVVDSLIGEGGSPTKRKKYDHSTTTKVSTISEKGDPNMSPFISEFPIVDTHNSHLTNTLTNNPTNVNTVSTINPSLSSSHNLARGPSSLAPFSPSLSSLPTSALPPPHSILSTAVNDLAATSRSSTTLKFDAMKNDIARFRSEMNSLQSEIDSLQEQLQIKKAEEQLLKYLQEGISTFRDKIKQRIELLRTEMISQNDHTHPKYHDRQVQIASSELIQLRDMGNDLKSAFQHQFARYHKHNKMSPSSSNLSSSC